MKRLNPKTNQFFKKGDIREDGCVFYQYRRIITSWSSPYFVEYWLKPELFLYHNHVRRSGENRRISELAATMLRGAKVRCEGSKSREKQGRKATNGKVTIGKEWIIKKLEAGVCEATGDKLTMAARKPNSPSLDRIDPNNPDYSPENCRVTTWQFNNMKGVFSDDEFIRIAKALKNVKQKQLTSIPATPDTPGRKNSEHGVIHVPRIG